MRLTRRVIREMAQRIYNMSNPPRSIEALEEIVDKETDNMLSPRKLKRITEKVADCEVKPRPRRASR